MSEAATERLAAPGDDVIEAVGGRVWRLAEELYPIPRSLTGEGVRQTLARLAEIAPLELRSVATGTPILDWTAPLEWNVREAWIEGPDGRRIVDSADSSLHLLGYSVPFSGQLSREALDEHLYSLPEQPDLIPYRTSYWAERWGFCLPHRVRERLPEGQYRVEVDTSLEVGTLDWGEAFFPGERQDEVLISTHCCHPALANDNLSGLGVAAELAAWVAARPRHLSYRFLFVPGTVGALAWLASQERPQDRVVAGLVLANLGDSGPFHFKRSRRGESLVDRAAELALDASVGALEDFVPFGYDERQYCSPGFDLPVGCFSRTPWGRYPEYHTSADDLELIRPRALGESFCTLARLLSILDGEARYRNLAPFGEPQLGRRGLYRSLGGESNRDREMARLWVLSMADSGLIAIARRSGLPFEAIRRAADDLLGADLLEEMR